jgi:hypothetical protein
MCVSPHFKGFQRTNMTQINTNTRPPLTTWVHPYEGLRQQVSGHPNLRQVTNQPQPYAQMNVVAPPNRVYHVSANLLY